MLSGDWEAAEQRAAAGPDERAGSDEEVYGDFEDIEAGLRQFVIQTSRHISDKHPVGLRQSVK